MSTGLATEQLVVRVYDELRRLALRQITPARGPETIEATSLVHEAWLRLDREGRATWESRAQFFVAAAQAMRRILVERARSRTRLRSAGSHRRVALTEGLLARDSGQGLDGIALLELDEALDGLRAFDESLALLVELRAFIGLTEGEAARVMGVSERTSRRSWRAARLWLLARIRASRGEGASDDR